MKEYLKNLKKRIIENFVKNKVLLIVFTLIWVVVSVVTISSYSKTLGKESTGNESYYRSVVEVNKDTKIVQTSPIEENGECVSILMANFADPARKGEIYVSIDGKDSKFNYAKETIVVENIQDNAYYTIKLNEKLNSKKDKNIIVTITSNSEIDEGGAIYYSNIPAFEGSSLVIDGEFIKDADLSMRYLVANPEFANFSRSVIGWTIFGLVLLTYVLILINPKKEVLFALSVFIMGLIFMVIIVPMSPPDEQTHYEVVLQMSNKMMGIKDNLVDSVYLKYGSMYGHYNISAGYSRFMKEINEPVKLTGQLLSPAGSIDDKYFIQYLPITLGITLGRVLGLNMITTIYTARMVNLIMYTACVYFAIKKAPTFKFLIGMVAIMPMLIQTSISVTYDTFVNSLSILIFGFFLNWYFEDKKIGWLEFIICAVACNILAPAKVVYGFLAFLFFFVPTNRYKNVWVKFVLTFVICASSIYQLYDIMAGPLTILINTIIANKVSYTTLFENVKEVAISFQRQTMGRGAGVPEGGYSFSYIFKHPLDTMMIFYRTIRYKIKTWFYGSIGRSLSGDTLILPLRLVHIMVLVLMVAIFIENDLTFNPLFKLVIFVILVLIGLYIIVGFFVSWTGMDALLFDNYDETILEVYGGPVVEGVQGRYFSPLLPYFFALFPNKKIKLPKKLDKYVYFAYLLIFFEVVIYVLSYTFVN